MAKVIKIITLSAMYFLFSVTMIVPVSGISDYDYKIIFEAYDINSDGYALYTMGLDGDIELIYQQATDFGNIFVSPNRTEILFQNSPDEFYVFDIGAVRLDEITPTHYNINPNSTILRWEETLLISATVNDNQISVFESTDYFSTSKLVAEIKSFGLTQNDFANLNLNLINLSPSLKYVATPMILSETMNRVMTPSIFIWDLEDNFRLLERFEYPVEWWYIPRRSEPLWISDTSIAFLVHDGTYQTQRIVLYDTVEADFSIKYELTCPTCNFISHLTYNENSGEIIFWQPNPDVGWELIGVDVKSAANKQYLVADTVPSPILISPDGQYLVTSILNSTNSLAVIDVATGEVITEQVIMHENIEPYAWVISD